MYGFRLGNGRCVTAHARVDGACVVAQSHNVRDEIERWFWPQSTLFKGVVTVNICGSSFRGNFLQGWPFLM